MVEGERALQSKFLGGMRVSVSTHGNPVVCISGRDTNDEMYCSTQRTISSQYDSL
jgi:hypothetical protein